MTDIFHGLGIRVKTLGREDFLKLKETLTRIGVLFPPNTLYQTCYILHKRGQYAIMHHKEMKVLDGDKEVEITAEDLSHRNTVAHLLDQWDLVELDEEVEDERVSVTVIPHKDKERMILKPLYEIGKPKN